MAAAPPFTFERLEIFLGMQLIETFKPLFLGSDYSIFQSTSGEIL
jgi:hypothetical protein